MTLYECQVDWVQSTALGDESHRHEGAEVVTFPHLRGRVVAKGADVERINQFEFFELGETLQKLKAFEGEVDANAAFFPIYEAREAMSVLVEGKPLELVVSKASAARLLAALSKVIQNHYTETSDSPPSWKFPTTATPPIPGWQWSEVSKSLSDFETIFREEMREAATYRVPNRGIYDTGKLIDSADQTFPAEVSPFIPQKGRDDWCAAGRCLAFNLLTASGFHVARAVEATLEAYYQYACMKKTTLHGWGDYIKALEATAGAPKTTLVPSDKVIVALKQMKDDYRNPIAHPRVVLTDPDARMLFANGESLIMAMALELKHALAKSASNSLTPVIVGP